MASAIDNVEVVEETVVIEETVIDEGLEVEIPNDEDGVKDDEVAEVIAADADADDKKKEPTPEEVKKFFCESLSKKHVCRMLNIPETVFPKRNSVLIGDVEKYLEENPSSSDEETAMRERGLENLKNHLKWNEYNFNVLNLFLKKNGVMDGVRMDSELCKRYVFNHLGHLPSIVQRMYECYIAFSKMDLREKLNADENSDPLQARERMDKMISECYNQYVNEHPEARFRFSQPTERIPKPFGENPHQASMMRRQGRPMMNRNDDVVTGDDMTGQTRRFTPRGRGGNYVPRGRGGNFVPRGRGGNFVPRQPSYYPYQQQRPSRMHQQSDYADEHHNMMMSNSVNNGNYRGLRGGYVAEPMPNGYYRQERGPMNYHQDSMRQPHMEQYHQNSRDYYQRPRMDGPGMSHRQNDGVYNEEENNRPYYNGPRLMHHQQGGFVPRGRGGYMPRGRGGYMPRDGMMSSMNRM